MRIAVGRVVYRHIEVAHSECWERMLLYLNDLYRDPHGPNRPVSGFVWKTLAGDALVSRARSRLATWFLEETDADVLVSIDADILFDPRNALGIAMHAHERQAVVGGLYMTRSLGSIPTASFFEGAPQVAMTGGAPLAPVRYLSGGFLAVPRAVFEKLAAAAQANEPEFDVYRSAFPEGAFWTFYAPFVVPSWTEEGKDVYLSEDWALCERARRAGFDILLDPGVRLGHLGDKVYRLEDLITPATQPAALALQVERRDQEEEPRLRVTRLPGRTA